MSTNVPSSAPATPDRPPPDWIAIIFKLVLGLAFGAATVYLVTLHDSHSWNDPKPAAGVVSGLALGLCLWLLIAAIAQARGRRFGRVPAIATIVLCMVAGGIVEPRVIQARRVSAEQAAWDRLQASPKRYEDYRTYELWTSLKRPEELPARALVRTEEELVRVAGLKSGRVEALRNLLAAHYSDTTDQNRAAMQPAVDLARQGLGREYDKALEDLAHRVSAGTEKREFPEDLQMRAAFHAVLSRLARSNDDTVYLVFSSDNQVGADASATQATTRPAKPPLPAQSVIESGEAFSAARQSRRRHVFVVALEDALKAAFAEPLVRIRELPEAEPRQGKVIFQANCTTRRVPGEFTLTRNGEPAGKLFSIEVAWEFSVFDVDGTLLTRNRSRSNPAESFRFSMKPSDPSWSAYSVMMDSAYYNYCREITGRLGMIPPPVQERFTFEK